MDLSVYHSLNDFAYDHHWFEVAAKFFAERGVVLFIVLLALLWLPFGRWKISGGRHAVVAAGFSAALGLGVNQVISHAYERTRPYVHHFHHLFVARSHDPSFPSDHATGAFAIAAAVFLRNRVAGTVALLLAVLVSVGRVAVGTHYPSDVLGGAAIGIAAALLLFLPPPRRLLDALAEFASRLYERVIAAGLRRQPAIRPSSGVRP
jgi:undecaprenyl-diphosphatase